MRWTAPDLQVEFMVISPKVARTGLAGGTYLHPRPFAGAQFCVRRPSRAGGGGWWVRGYARTRDELAALDVPATLIDRIEAAAAGEV